LPIKQRKLAHSRGLPGMKTLHIVESLNNGAVENWLVRMFAHGRSKGVTLDWTFYCTLDQPGRLDDQVRELGGRIVVSPAPLGDAVGFFKVLRAELSVGDYDVMHAHHDLMSGLYMAASANLGVRRRLVHIHNADEGLPTPNRLKAAVLRPVLRRLGLRADRLVGISNHTLDTFLQGRPRRPGRDLVHYYGIDSAPFSQDKRLDRTAFRASLGLPPDALILLFGGRVTPEKNPVFVVDVLAELRKLEPRAVAVFAGAGSLEDEVRARADSLGVSNNVHMMGWRSDLPQIMSAADWFILPRPEHPMEGFGLAVVEAQLAGLRMLLSRGVPPDPLLPTASVRLLSLAEPASAWARAAVDLLAEPAPDAEATHRALASSPMDMDRALADLLSLYA
jgi:glycosyltransferase involved in cell wall biosynthesis